MSRIQSAEGGNTIISISIENANSKVTIHPICFTPCFKDAKSILDEANVVKPFLAISVSGLEREEQIHTDQSIEFLQGGILPLALKSLLFRFWFCWLDGDSFCYIFFINLCIFYNHIFADLHI